MPGTLVSLGMFVFALDTLAYQELQRKDDWRFARNPRVGARDAVQYVGPGDSTINLSGTAFAELCDGAASLEDLRAMAADGEAWPLVSAAGIVFGDFVIASIDETGSVFDAAGNARRIEFGIELVAVGGDAAA